MKVTEAPTDGPWSTVALSSYVGAGGDHYATSAPEKPGARFDGIAAYLLATNDTGRRALFECRASNDDRYVSAACGTTPEEERLVGYAYTAEESGTVGLYRCETSAGDEFTSLDEACEGGRTVAELGYVYPPA